MAKVKKSPRQNNLQCAFFGLIIQLSMTQFTLYSRSYCHLCDDMLEQLRTYLASANLTLEIQVVDVDADDALIALYDELVPVLTAKKLDGPETQICHYFLDLVKVEAFLND
jgi:hypothetical protein